MPFGVEIPENLGVESTTPDPSPVEQPVEKDSNQNDLQEAARPEAPRSITDLDKLERFRFEGREWDPKSLKSAILAQADYTRKTQEVAEARKYADNFSIDLGYVLKDPSLLAKMRQIYPAEYVQHAEVILSRLQPAGNSGSSHQPAPMDRANEADNPLARDIQELKTWKEQWEHQQTEAKVNEIKSQLDKQFDSLSKKYEFADPAVINSWALAASEQGQKINEKVLETLFKQHHEQMTSRYDKLYRSKVESQKQAGLKARDIGPGGDAPSAPPIKARTIKEATARALADLDGATF